MISSISTSITSTKNTPERILDAAEALFAERDYDTVTTRAITEKAGVRLNLLSYHFETKDKLFKAVVDRRLGMIIQHREEAMTKLKALEQKMTVRQILEAFIHPYFELASHGDLGWLNYVQLIASMSQSERYFETLDNYTQNTMSLYLSALQKAIPGSSIESVKSGLYYANTLMMSSFWGVNRIKGLKEGVLNGEALKNAYAPLLIFAEAGIMALVAH